jgi:hypothetical protein
MGQFATGFIDTGGNFAAGVVDTGGKFVTGIKDTGSKLAAGVNDTGGKLPPVSVTLAANNGINIRRRYLKVNLKAKMYIW